MVAPLQWSGANDHLRVGIVHTVGDLPPTAPVSELPFQKGDRVCWIEGVGGPVHVLSEQLVIMGMGVPIAYEPASDLSASNGSDGQPAATAH